MNEIEKYFDEMSGRFNAYYADRSAGLFERLAHNFLREPGMRRRFHATIELLGKVNGKSILDAGCGTGVYTIYLARLGATVSAIDVSGKMLDLTHANARAAGVQPAEILQGDFLEYDFAQKFDHVLAIGVFDYISPERQGGHLKRLASLASHSVVATFPKLLTPQAPLRKLWFLGKKAKLYLYTRGQVRRLAEREGMQCKFVDCGPIWTVELTHGPAGPA
ncbi:MAG: methyltransferase domain-containing protein [Candidatus Hydrogenedentota bacterium]|nr:MAG: methyltransferase domain-containing protein [Candidatus Hydrogenedentota bacterium]